MCLWNLSEGKRQILFLMELFKLFREIRCPLTLPVNNHWEHPTAHILFRKCKTVICYAVWLLNVCMWLAQEFQRCYCTSEALALFLYLKYTVFIWSSEIINLHRLSNSHTDTLTLSMLPSAKQIKRQKRFSQHKESTQQAWVPFVLEWTQLS